MADLPTPVSRQDELLHNIADGTPDISDLEPVSREEEYLKYIALNGMSGGGGDIPLPVSIANGGTGATSADSARTNLDVYSKQEVDNRIPAMIFPLGIVNGGTGGTTATNARTNLGIYTREALYQNTGGTTSNVTLSKNVNNYDWLEIYFGHDEITNSVNFEPTLAGTGNNYVNLSLQYVDTTNQTLFIRTSFLNISNQNLTWARKHMIKFTIGGSSSFSDHDDEYVKLFGVYGFKH